MRLQVLQPSLWRFALILTGLAGGPEAISSGIELINAIPCSFIHRDTLGG